MPDHSPKNRFRDGFKDSLPVLLSAAPFGMLFGALAVKNGFTIFEAVLMSATVFAGASQMVGIELFGAKVAPWLIVFSIFAVNFRHILYSAAIGAHLRFDRWWKGALCFFLMTDPQYAETEKRAERNEPISFAWYMGMAVPIYVLWVLEAWIGALFGNLIEHPEKYGIDFFLPIYFLAMVMGFRKRARWLPTVIASGIASVIAYKILGSPWHVSVGALTGVLMAALLAPSTPVDTGTKVKP